MNAALESAVGWAFTKTSSLRGEPTTALLVLVAFAHHADLETNRPEGYRGTTTSQVAAMTGLSESTVGRYARNFERRGWLAPGAWTSMFRVSEAAFNRA